MAAEAKPIMVQAIGISVMTEPGWRIPVRHFRDKIAAQVTDFPCFS